MSLTSIVDTAYKIPRAFIQVSLGVGIRSPGAAPMRILLTGNKTASGTAANAELKLLTGPDDAKTYFGVGSELHLMAIACFKANPAATVYAIAIAAAGTASTSTLTFTGGPATAAGTVEVWICGERVVAQVASGDSITAVAAAVAVAINNRTDLPVTATPAVGVVTVTAKNTGPRGSRISMRSLLTGGTAVAHTPATGYLSGGATMDDPQTVLDTVISERFHLIVAPYFTATELTKYKTHVSTQAQPIQGRRQRFIACLPDTLANCITIADTENEKRGQLLWLEDPDDLPAMVAAGFAGAVAAKLSSDRAHNLDGLVISGLKTQYDLADVPTESEQNSALSNGLTPLLGKGGVVSIVRSVTSYHQDAAGNDDFAVLDTHYVDVPDFIGDDIEGNFSSVFSGFKIAPDGEDGAPPAPKVATPLSVRDFLFGRLKTYENKLIVNVDANKAGLIVEADGTAVGRMNAEIPVDCIELFHQLAANISQIG